MQLELDKLKNRQPGIQNHAEFALSAVLLPLVETPAGTHILFETRSAHINRQPGEICFPGGMAEDTEVKDPQLTAVRETTEELGIDACQVEVIGPLDYLLAPAGVIVYPFVGKILEPQKIAPNRSEVKEIFTLPVEFFLQNPPLVSSIKMISRFNQDFPFDKVPDTYKENWCKGWSFKVYFFEYGSRVIWGLTAKVIVNFIELCWPGNIHYRF